MKIRRRRLLALVALAACSDPAGPEVAEVRVTPETPSVDVGLTVQFSAQAFDAAGNALTGLTVSWTSSNGSVASIDGTGLATGLTVGTSAITATIGGVPDSEVLTVDPTQCNNRVDVVLAPGEFQTYPGNQCLLLPSGQTADRYRVAVARPTLIEDSLDVPNVTLRADPILSAELAPIAVPPQLAAPAASALSAGLGIDGTRILQDVERMRRTRAFHYELREREASEGLHLRPALPSRPALAAPALVDPPDRLDMYLDLDCSVANLQPVRLINFNDDIAIYQDSVEWDDEPLAPSATSQMLAYYASHARNMIADYVGVPSDLDGNERIIVVTTSALPEQAAAAVYSGDFTSTATCAGSNEGEVIYFDREVIDNVVDADPSYLALSVLAHEVQHIVSIYHGVRRGQFHRTWMEEGRSEVVQTLSSRIAWASTGGPAVGAEIEGQAIIDAAQANNGDVTREMWGLVGQVADLIVSLHSQPNSLVTDPNGRAQFHTFYANRFHFHRFIGDAYGSAATPFGDASLFKSLADSLTPARETGLAQVTGSTFDELFEEVVLASSTHKSVGATPAMGFSTWNFQTTTAIFASPIDVAPPGLYPWPVTTDVNGNMARPFTTGVYSCPPRIQGGNWVAPPADARCGIGPSGVRYHDFSSSGTGQGLQILVTGAASGKIIVTRLN